MKRIIFTILFSAMIFTDYCFAVPARRTPVAVPLPDGTTLTVQLWGDEFAHYYTSADHYLLLKAPDGYFYYAEDCPENGLRFQSQRYQSAHIGRDNFPSIRQQRATS